MSNLIKRIKGDLFIEILKDPDRKSIFKMVYEFIYLFIIYRELPVHYLSRYLFKSRTKNIKDYLPNKFLSKVPSHFNEKKVKQVLDNKLYFHLFYSQFSISLTKFLMYNHKNIFVISGRSISVRTINDFKDLLEEVFNKNSSSDSIFIKKTYASSSGNKVYKLFKHQIRTEPDIINELFSEVIKSEFIFQETVKQHPALNKLNPSSLNTIRIDTFIDSDGKIDVISAQLRMSTNNSHVDNISSGGCFVSIPLNTGKLKKFGYSMIRTIGTKVLKEHPVTKTTFENYPIPFFPEVKKLVLEAATFMPELRLIGWDVAIGEEGPVLIEGNSDYEIRGSDFSDGGYLANPIFRKVLREINEDKKLL